MVRPVIGRPTVLGFLPLVNLYWHLKKDLSKKKKKKLQQNLHMIHLKQIIVSCYSSGDVSQWKVKLPLKFCL